MAKKKSKVPSKLPKPAKPTKQSVVCEDCGRLIPKIRLKILPDATLCVQCMSVRESKGEALPEIIFDDYDASELLDTITPDD